MKSFLYNIIRYNKRRCNLFDSTNRLYSRNGYTNDAKKKHLDVSREQREQT